MALRRIETDQELCFDYGVGYWCGRAPPLPSSDSRDYSPAGWELRDQQRQWLEAPYPLRAGSVVPLTPLRAIELQAALIMPEDEYSPLKELILDPKLDVVRSLSDLCHSDRIPLASSLLRIFR